MTRRGAVGLLAAGIVGSVLPIAAGASAEVPPSAYADQPVPCAETTVPDTEVLADSSTKDNAPLDRMHVPQAHEITRGRGVSVVVIDSGVQPGLGIDQGPALRVPDVAGPLLSGHGTIVSALIAGPEGVAPEAQVIDVRVFDSSDPDEAEGEKPVTSQGMAAGIQQAIDLYESNPFHVVNISLSVDTDDPELRKAVKELQGLGVVVVASSGNADETDENFKGTPGNDAAVYPADYQGVVGVSAAAPREGTPIGSVVPNLDTDVAAPTVGGISINANGTRCDIEELATSWATAEVSGVLALLRSAHPRDTAKQSIARLMATTEGSEDARNPWTGAGVVQAHDALTRSLDPGRSGKIERSVLQNRNDAVAPPPPVRLDPFGSSRALLLWCGLGGGALMALAFMLRSLVRR
jgi:membrane-anchored mycosin MYCP